MFRFIVNYLKIFKHIPFFALWLDAAMMITNMIFRPEVILSIEKIEDEVSAWKGVTLTLHKFGGLQFNYGKTELGHIHSNGILDVLFSRQLKHSLIKDGLAEDHHVFKQSGWTSFYIRSSHDIDKALYLLALSYRRIAGREAYPSPSIPFANC
jgi:hypothetical protein